MPEGTDRGRWAAGRGSDPAATLAGFQEALPVRLIATPRERFVTCRPDELLSDVVDRNRRHDFDDMPVMAPGGDGGTRVVGLVELARYMRGAPAEGTVGAAMQPLSEDTLIGADASILDFIRDADTNRCRLVVSGERISGLVTLSDLQQLPVRAALFALITHLEMTLADAIRRGVADVGEAIGWLPDNRQKEIARWSRKAQQGDVFIDPITYSTFRDKALMLHAHPGFPWASDEFKADMERAKNLRNDLVHALDYAGTREAAALVCQTVRTIDRWVATLEGVARHSTP